MIPVTSLSKKQFYLNPDLIYRLEETPDTMVTLVDGKTLLVIETADEVIQRIIEYRQKIQHARHLKEE
jgi:flagellar protein FlbD